MQWSQRDASAFALTCAEQTVRRCDLCIELVPVRYFLSCELLEFSLFQAHEEDINVLSWNPGESYWLLTHSDNKLIKLVEGIQLPVSPVLQQVIENFRV